MARARSSSREVDPALELEPDQSIEEFLAGIGDDATKVVVYRYDPQTAKQDYCGSLPWPGVDVPEEIRKRWGGGRFSIRFYGPPTSDRQSGYVGHKMLGVAGPVRDLSRVLEPEAETERDRRRAEEAEARVAELERMKTEDRVTAALEELKGFVRELRNPPPAADQVAPFRLALELVREMQTRLVPHVETPLKDGKDMLELFRMGLELGRETAAAPGPYDTVVERVGIPLVRILEARMSSPAPQLAAGNPPSGPRDLRAALEPFVPHLASWAARGVDALTRADLIADELPLEWHDAVAELVSSGSAVTTLLDWFPQLAAHRPWVETLVSGLREDLIPEAPAEELAGEELDSEA